MSLRNNSSLPSVTYIAINRSCNGKDKNKTRDVGKSRNDLKWSFLGQYKISKPSPDKLRTIRMFVIKRIRDATFNFAGSSIIKISLSSQELREIQVCGEAWNLRLLNQNHNNRGLLNWNINFPNPSKYNTCFTSKINL